MQLADLCAILLFPFLSLPPSLPLSSPSSEPVRWEKPRRYHKGTSLAIFGSLSAALSFFSRLVAWTLARSLSRTDFLARILDPSCKSSAIFNRSVIRRIENVPSSALFGDSRLLIYGF